MIIFRRKQNVAKRVAIGSTIAAVAGYAAGLLTAPKSGKETRKDIKSAADKTVIEAEKDLKKLHTELGKAIDQTKANSGKLNAKAQAELKLVVTNAKDAKEKVREVLSAIHEGDAEDKDLARAVKNANTSINNLKKYLKKK